MAVSANRQMYLQALLLGRGLRAGLERGVDAISQHRGWAETSRRCDLLRQVTLPIRQQLTDNHPADSRLSVTARANSSRCPIASRLVLQHQPFKRRTFIPAAVVSWVLSSRQVFHQAAATVAQRRQPQHHHPALEAVRDAQCPMPLAVPRQLLAAFRAVPEDEETKGNGRTSIRRCKATTSPARLAGRQM